MPRHRASVSEVQAQLSHIRLERVEERERQQQGRSRINSYDLVVSSTDAFDPQYHEPAGQQDELGQGVIRIRMGEGREPMVVAGFPSAPDGHSTELMRAEYNEAVRLWRGSPCRDIISTVLKEYLEQTDWKCKFAICMGIGSLSRGDLATRKKSMFRLAAFLDIALQLPLTDNTTTTIPVLYQERVPKLTSLDIDFLATLDVETYHVPAGTTEVTVGGFLRQHTMDSNCFIFEAGIDDLHDFIEKFEQIKPGLLVSSLMDTTDLMRVVALRDEAAKIKMESDLDLELFEELEGDVENAMQTKKFREDYSVMRFPNFEEWPMDPFRYLKLLFRVVEEREG